jgi:hypothetical protein
LIGLGLPECDFLFGLFNFADDFLDHEGVFGFDEVEEFFPDEDSVVKDFFGFLFGLIFILVDLVRFGRMRLVFEEEFHHWPICYINVISMLSINCLYQSHQTHLNMNSNYIKIHQ